jgi:hypothetical protein
MKVKDDQTMSPIVMGIAIDLHLDVSKVESVIESYYGEIANMIASDKPYEVKLDYFGKIRAKKQYVAYRESRLQAFEELNKVHYGTVPIQQRNEGSRVIAGS